jgi:imidazolonepropionase-like amidohydrolase
MRKLLLLLIMLPALTFSQENPKVIASDVAIVNVTVIDGTGNAPLADMTVFITGDSIVSILQSNSSEPADGTKVISGRGMYLIPGLWDMHVHISHSELFLPLLIANGVTSVRQMTCNEKYFRYLSELRGQISEKKIIGPDIYIPVVIFGKDQQWDGIMQMNTKEDAVAVIRKVKDSGADFVKIFDLYEPEAFKALLYEAKKQNVPVGGHCPIVFNMSEVAREGMGTFEHLFGILLACSSNEDSIRQQLIQTVTQHSRSFDDIVRLLYWVQTDEILKTHDPVKAHKLFSDLKKSGSYQCPNFILWDGWLKLNETLTTNDDRFKYVPDSYLKTWRKLSANPMSAKLSDEDFMYAKEIIGKNFEILQLLCEAGVPMIAGTDVSWTNPYNFPGFGLHDELNLLVKAGLTPMEAIQAATKNAATVLGVLDKTGTVEPGKQADLILLDANPLENINNTRKINAVFRAGRYLSRADLDTMLQKEETMVQYMK